MTLFSTVAPILLAANAVQAPPNVRSGLLQTAEVTLWFEVHGGGPGIPLIVINGGPGVSHSYLLATPVWEQLARNRPVVFYDQRGVGNSGPLAAKQSCTLADRIADLESLRVHLKYKQIALLGHSWGGLLAMHYASTHPARVTHLVVSDSPHPNYSETRMLFEDLYPDVIARRSELAGADVHDDGGTDESSFRDYQSMLACSPEHRAAMRAGALPALNLQVNEAVVADVRLHDLTPALAKFTVPTLVLTGRFDANVAPATAWKIHQLIPGAQLTIFERSGHVPFYEEPEAFRTRVETFLNTGK